MWFAHARASSITWHQARWAIHFSWLRHSHMLPCYCFLVIDCAILAHSVAHATFCEHSRICHTAMLCDSRAFISSERTQFPPQRSRTFSISGHTSTLSYTARCQWQSHQLQPELCHMNRCRKQLVDERWLQLVDCFQRSMPYEILLWLLSCKHIVAPISVAYLVWENNF